MYTCTCIHVMYTNKCTHIVYTCHVYSLCLLLIQNLSPFEFTLMCKMFITFMFILACFQKKTSLYLVIYMNSELYFLTSFNNEFQQNVMGYIFFIVLLLSVLLLLCSQVYPSYTPPVFIRSSTTPKCTLYLNEFQTSFNTHQTIFLLIFPIHFYFFLCLHTPPVQLES